MQTTLTGRLSENGVQEIQAVSELTGKSRCELVWEAPRAREIGWADLGNMHVVTPREAWIMRFAPHLDC